MTLIDLETNSSLVWGYNQSMKRIWLSLLSIFFFLVFFPKSIALAVSNPTLPEQIDSFDSQIIINQDTSLTIREKIVYQTTLEKHGIYRYLPIDYNRDGLKYRMKIDHLSVKDEQNHDVPYQSSYDSQFLTIKIGDPDATFTGEKIYQIEYQVQKAVTAFADHDELYWDITGEGWRVPILKSSAQIISQFASIDKIDCFTGVFGGNDNLCQKQISKTSQANFSYNQEIGYGQNFTVVIGLNKDNQLIFPSKFDNLMMWLWYNWVLFLIPLPLLIIFIWWWKKGRDFEFISANVFELDPNKPFRQKAVQLSARVPMVYEPLKDLTPGESGALIDEKVDPRDVVAEILELARQKFLKIELIEEKKLFGKNRDYQLTKLKPISDKLTEVQQYLHQELFDSGDQVKISKLKGKFYLTMQKASEKLESSLMEKKVYTGNPSLIRGIGITVFIFMLAGVFGLVMIKLAPFQIYWPIPLLILQAPLGLVLAYNLAQKTAVGYNLWLQAKGLKQTIQYGKWREQIKEKNLFIEEVLPFAVSLGVVDQLAKQMQELNLKPPEYLQATNMTTWSTAQFVSGFSSEVGSSLSYNPSSSSSGGSGFGGSSGGGGGGGGGGSW